MLGKCELGAFGQNFRNTELTPIKEAVYLSSAKHNVTDSVPSYFYCG